jgi:hypothetical protein
MHLEYFNAKQESIGSNELALQSAVGGFTQALLPLLASHTQERIISKLIRETFDSVILEVTDREGSIKIKLTAQLG